MATHPFCFVLSSFDIPLSFRAERSEVEKSVYPGVCKAPKYNKLRMPAGGTVLSYGFARKYSAFWIMKFICVSTAAVIASEVQLFGKPWLAVVTYSTVMVGMPY